jgi:uncharacterized SAM-binding protein YcdF (DUF218 family)
MLFALLLTPFRSQGKGVRRIQFAALVVVLLLCWMPTAWLINYALERPYLAELSQETRADAIVVFSGGAWPPTSREPYPVPLADTIQRTRHAAWLYSKFKVPVVACGGRFTYEPDAAPVAELMRELLMTWGVPESDIVLEEKGRSTFEQAMGAGKILQSRGAERVLVVTDAFHMRRADGMLRKLGITTQPAACGFRSMPSEVRWTHFVPGDRALELTNDALREWAALAYYRLQGRI